MIRLSQDKLRLNRLLEHWIEHSREHMASFNEWAERAEKLGLSSASTHIYEAVKKMEEVVQSLQKAYEETQ